MSKAKTVYNANDQLIVATLKGASEGMTLAEFNAATGKDLKAGSFTSAIKKGLIEAIGDREIVRSAKAKRTVYEFVTSDVLTNSKDGKAFNYTDGEKDVLKAAATIDGEFMLADLANAMNVKSLASGRINGLIMKGNIRKLDEKREVATTAKAKVKVYGFKADIPADAVIASK